VLDTTPFLGSKCSYLHNSRAIVRDSLLAILVYHEQITAIGTKCSFDSRLYC